jgi:hypothetical protein
MHDVETSARSASTRNHFWKRLASGDATKEQAKDTGMALVLILLLLALRRRQSAYVPAAIGLHLVNMIAPQAFRPAAVLWFAFSHVLGNITSRIIMVVAFFGVVTPVGVLRRWSGADALKLKSFKVGRSSVMAERNHTFTGKDIEKPY